MKIQNVDNLKTLIINDLGNVSKIHRKNIDYSFLNEGVDELIDILYTIKTPDDLNNFILFPIPEKINMSINGTVVTSLLIESDIRSSIVKSVEEHLKKQGIHIDSINQKIEKQWIKY